MRLTPRELERLQLFSAAELARKRRARGVKLNYPEAVALICDEVIETARDGKSMEEAIEWVRRCPNPHVGDSDIEIRPFFEPEDFA